MIYYPTTRFLPFQFNPESSEVHLLLEGLGRSCKESCKKSHRHLLPEVTNLVFPYKEFRKPHCFIGVLKEDNADNKDNILKQFGILVSQMGEDETLNVKKNHRETIIANSQCRFKTGLHQSDTGHWTAHVFNVDIVENTGVKNLFYLRVQEQKEVYEDPSLSEFYELKVMPDGKYEPHTPFVSEKKYDTGTKSFKKNSNKHICKSKKKAFDNNNKHNQQNGNNKDVHIDSTYKTAEINFFNTLLDVYKKIKVGDNLHFYQDKKRNLQIDCDLSKIEPTHMDGKKFKESKYGTENNLSNLQDKKSDNQKKRVIGCRHSVPTFWSFVGYLLFGCILGVVITVLTLTKI